MNDNSDTSRQRTERGSDSSAIGVATIALLGCLALPIVVGWLSTRLLAEHPFAWQRRRRLPVVIALAIVGTLGLLAVIPSPLMGWLWPLGWGTIGALLTVWLLLAPWGMLVALLRLPYCATALAEGRAQPDKADRWRRAIWNAATKDAAANANAWKHQPQALGAVLNDDKRDAITRLRDRRDSGRAASRWADTERLTLPDAPPRVALFGASGYGKTWTLHRMIAAALAKGWRVAVFDGKGRSKDASALQELAANSGRSTVWWRSRPHAGGCPFDAWQGDKAQVVAKALALLGQARQSPDASDAAKHYRRQNLGVLAAVAGHVPWGSSEELLQRLRNPAPWVTERARLAELKTKDRATGQPIHLRVAGELAANMESVGRTLDGRSSSVGWCWEEEHGAPWDLAVITINGAEESAATLPGAVMLADLAAYLNDEKRRPEGARPLLVILDEAQTLLDSPDAPEVALAFEQMRSANAGIVVACQSVQGLGEQGERIIRAGADFIVGNMAEADDLVALAGTVRAPELAHQGTDDGTNLTGQTAAREQLQQRLDPDRLREVKPGVFAIVERGRPVIWVSMCPSIAGLAA